MEVFWNINRSAIPAPKICFLSLFLFWSVLGFVLHAMTILVPTRPRRNYRLTRISHPPFLHHHELSLPSPVYTCIGIREKWHIKPVS
ncbi:hypothetical protein F4678DRAFT_448050 [Xylaria arbuscula]|nr:hypothetical protein F4678DRAFT_448050 [Xylaria arbuscula]